MIWFTLLSPWVLYLFYAAVMNLKRARDEGKMTPAMKVFGLPMLYVGLLLDVFVNLIPVSLLLLELPKEWLVTSRFSRHIKKTGWRSRVAKWFCTNLLDSLDPSGCHCK